MKTKSGSFAAVLLACALLITGCQGTASSVPETSSSSRPVPTSLPQVSGGGPGTDFVIYRMSEAQEWFNLALARFNAAYGKEINIIFENFSSAENYRDRVLTEMMSGAGPDIIFAQYLEMNFDKIMRNGAFFDMYPYFALDKDFHEEDYLNRIFEAGFVDGKQYIIPATVRSPIMIGNAAQLENVGIHEITKGSTADFLRQIAQASQLAEQNPNFSQMLNQKGLFKIFCGNSNLQLIDYEQKAVCTDEETLRDFFEAYKGYYKYDQVTGGNYGFCTWLNLQPVTERYYIDFAQTVYQFASTASLLKSYEGYRISVMRSADGEMIMPYRNFLAVNANTKNPDYAYQLIKIFLSPEIQGEIDAGFSMSAIHRETISDQVRFWQSKLTTGKTQDEYVFTQLTDSEVQEYLDLFDECGGGSLPQTLVYDMVWEAMEPYFRDEKTYESCFEELKSRLFLYMDE